MPHTDANKNDEENKIIHILKTIPSSLFGVSYNFQNYLHIAAEHNFVSLFDACLKALSSEKQGTTQIQANTGDIQGRTPLILAAMNNHPDMVDKLLALKGINVSAVDHLGNTALHYAAYHGRLEIVRKILSTENSNPNILNREGIAPLYYSIQEGHDFTTLELLKHGKIILNGIGPKPILELKPNSNLLRYFGALEARPSTETDYSKRAESVEKYYAKISLENSLERLSNKFSAEDIKNGYRDFKKYLKSNDFIVDLKELCQRPFGEDGLAAIFAKEFNSTQFETLVKSRIFQIHQLFENKLIVAGEKAILSNETIADFKNAVSIIWQTLKKTDGWKAIRMDMTEEEVQTELTNLRLTFLRRLFGLSYEKFNPLLQQDPRDPNAFRGCPKGMPGLVVGAFSLQHDDIFVSDVPQPSIEPHIQGPIMRFLTNNDFEALERFIKNSFHVRYIVLRDLMAGTVLNQDPSHLLSQSVYEDFFENKLNLTNKEHRFFNSTLGFFVGHLKHYFSKTQVSFLSTLNDEQTAKVYALFEDALKMMPIELLYNILTKSFAQMLKISIEREDYKFFRIIKPYVGKGKIELKYETFYSSFTDEDKEFLKKALTNQRTIVEYYPSKKIAQKRNNIEAMDKTPSDDPTPTKKPKV